jgi:hypothetical protein
LIVRAAAGEQRVHLQYPQRGGIHVIDSIGNRYARQT